MPQLHEIIAVLEKALTEIANGDGTYGAQAYEYKQIAREALAKEAAMIAEIQDETNRFLQESGMVYPEYY